MADNDAFLRKLAARIGLPADATTNADLERALASRLGFDRRTDEWAIGWLEGLVGRGQSDPVRVVQEPRERTEGPALTRRRRAKVRP